MAHGTVKQQLRSALEAAMRGRDEISLSALRQALAAVSVAETAGDAHVELTDEQVLGVIAAEVRKHHETADAFATAGRPERVERARAEAAVLEVFLPAALDDDALRELITATIAEVAPQGGMKAMGSVVAAVRAAAGPTADGARIAALVKAALS